MDNITENLFHLLDLTCLKETTTALDIKHLVEEGQKHQVAALCVWPRDLKYIPKDCKIQKATVVNFPSGHQSLEEVILEVETILKQHPHTEIDYVFPYQTYLSGAHDKALQHCQSIATLCHQKGVIIKVILETGLFPNADLIEEAALSIIACGADFLKTSTGKAAIGATPDAVLAICHAIVKSHQDCGIKISGGVKSMCQALTYLEIVHDILPKVPNARWFRIGSSQLVDDLTP